MSTTPIKYADAQIQTERLGELHQCLMAHGFALTWVEDKEQQYWAVRDDGKQRDDDAGE